MPWADKRKCVAASNDWNKRNRAKMNAAKKRWRDKQRRLRAAVTVKYRSEPRRPKVTPEQNKYFRKLRRLGIPLKRAQALAYGEDYLQYD